MIKCLSGVASGSLIRLRIDAFKPLLGYDCRVFKVDLATAVNIGSITPVWPSAVCIQPT